MRPPNRLYDGSIFSANRIPKVRGPNPKQQCEIAALFCDGCWAGDRESAKHRLPHIAFAVITDRPAICRFTTPSTQHRRVRTPCEPVQLRNKCSFPARKTAIAVIALPNLHIWFYRPTRRPDLGNGKHVRSKLADRNLGWRAYLGPRLDR